MPLARDLAASGYEVTGVDLSTVQVQRARQLVPAARFLHADATQVEFPAASFDAVVSRGASELDVAATRLPRGL